MRLPITVHRARLGKHSYRVIRPRPTPPNVVLSQCSTAASEYDMRLDARAAHRIGVAWLLAARSPRSLVHIPLRSSRSPASARCEPECFRHEECPYSTAERPLDLLLVHRGLQFRPSRWKEVRARLDNGRPETAELPTSDAPEFGSEPFEFHWIKRYPLRQHVHAETLLLTGNAPLFRELSTYFLDIAGNGPGSHSWNPRKHYCNEIRWPEIGRYDQEIHIVYDERWSGTDTKR
ncbi:hypothetical protein SAMN04487819_10921 [Actinopolyspora alba]|uniref:Uncharacterized protein n=1 Tax=Actinopolyspora alba TaxID=673379 RepID=A0A1I1YGU1_9ACTN|nr:hypothetical protein [Actinopolyspora alba]SFE18824.1 hypothetical protein SAMN04487819_10921 [Actinopolyspora alba]